MNPIRPLRFVQSSHDDLKALPEQVQDDIGYDLHKVQIGETPASAKPLKGFSGVTVMEIISDFDTKYVSRRLHGEVR